MGSSQGVGAGMDCGGIFYFLITCCLDFVTRLTSGASIHIIKFVPTNGPHLLDSVPIRVY
jgi:hypothetical protein